MNKEIVRLRIVGVTSNQIENGMYALVLEEEDGKRRLPIIVGYTEAQSIECLLQRIQTPRPLTHEFTSGILKAFDITIESVMIKQLENGIFAADVTLTKGSETHVLDARSSDAIAMAMRLDAPIFTTRELMDACGVERETFAPRSLHDPSRQSIPARQAIERVMNPAGHAYSNETDEKLLSMMEKAVSLEDYEKAGEIKMEIERRHGKH